MMDLDEAIKHCEEVATKNEKTIAYYTIQGDKEWLDECEKDCIECAKEHRQLVGWLKELKIHREIHDVLLQLLVDFDLDNCCIDLMDNEEERKICEENCNNQAKGCWVRWARLKAKEVNTKKGVLDQINEKQDSLKATCKAWDEAIKKDGYVD